MFSHNSDTCENILECYRKADLVLILDQSTSIVENEPNYDNWFVQVLGFAKSIVGAFPIGADLTQVGVMKFNQTTQVVFNLNRYGEKAPLENAIGSIDIFGGDTNIAGALRTAREVMFSPSNGARSDVPKIIILLTDGTANVEEENTQDEATKTKDADITVFTVGVTRKVKEEELKAIASKPEYYFYVSAFSDLNSIVHNLIRESCEVLPTLPPRTTTTSMQQRYNNNNNNNNNR